MADFEGNIKQIFRSGAIDDQEAISLLIKYMSVTEAIALVCKWEEEMKSGEDYENS